MSYTYTELCNAIATLKPEVNHPMNFKDGRLPILVDKVAVDVFIGKIDELQYGSEIAVLRNACYDLHEDGVFKYEPEPE